MLQKLLLKESFQKQQELQEIRLQIKQLIKLLQQLKITKITKLLYNIPDKVPRFVNKIWIEVYDQSGNADDIYKPPRQIRFKKSMLQSDLCNYSDEYFNVVGTIAATESNNDAYDKKLALKDNAPFIGCISNVNSVLIVMPMARVMPMYNLTE